MFKSLITPKTLITAASVGVLAACSHVPHDEDSLYVHGFIAPLGESSLSTLAADSRMHVILSKGDEVIGKQKITTAENWPSAYKIEFKPTQLEDQEGELVLSLELAGDKEQGADLVYQKQIDLDDPRLFGTHVNMLVTPYSIKTTSENMEQADAENSSYDALFETFQCDGGKIQAALSTDYIVLNNGPQTIIPRVTSQPQTVYKIADTRMEFHKDSSFELERNNKSYRCELNENSEKLWQEAKTLVKEAEEKQIESDKEAAEEKKIQ